MAHRRAVAILATFSLLLVPFTGWGSSSDALGATETVPIATQLSLPTSLVADPAGRGWVTDARLGFCRLSDATPTAAGSVEAASCLGGSSGTRPGPRTAGAAAYRDPTPGTPGSGDEIVLIPDRTQGSSGIARARWDAAKKLFVHDTTLTVYDGDLRPKAVTMASDGSAYVVFERSRAVVRILRPESPQPQVEMVASVPTANPHAVAAGIASPSGTTRIFVGSSAGLSEFTSPQQGISASPVPGKSYSVPAPSALFYDAVSNALFAGSGTGTAAAQDGVTRVTIADGLVQAVSGGFSRVTGLGMRGKSLLVLDDAGLLTTASPSRTGSAHLLIATPAIVTGPTPSHGAEVPDPVVTADSTPAFTVASDMPSLLLCAVTPKSGTPAWSACPSATLSITAALADGEYLFAVKHGSTGAPTARRFVVDTAAPAAPRIVQPVAGQTVGRNVLLEVVADPGASLRCTIGSAPPAPCASGQTLTLSTAGSTSIRVSAVDGAGNAGPASRVDVVVDLTPPQLTITTPASDGAVVTAPLRAEFSSPTADVRFRCRVDGAEFAACSSPATFEGLTPGAHRLDVEATSPLGNAATASRSFTIADTVAPTVTAAPASGQYRTGQTITLSVDEPASIHYTVDGTEPTTASARYAAPIPIPGSFTLRFFAVDTAGNASPMMREEYSLAGAATRHDFSGDGTVDVLSRDGGGQLLLHPGDGAGRLGAPLITSTGWNGMSWILTPGDFDGDGLSDVLARDSNGALWLYPGNGTGGWKARVLAGTGWNVMTAILGPGDFTGDGTVDVLARDSNGALWLYPGNGTGGWKARVLAGTGWNVMTAILGPGDFTGDGTVDVLARDSNGALWLYPGNGTGGWKARVLAGTGWNVMTAILGPGDFTGDGTVDVLARDSNGALWLYPGNGTGGWKPRAEVSGGWNGMSWIL